MIVTHMTTPTGKKDHKCSECSKAFIYNSHLIFTREFILERKSVSTVTVGKYSTRVQTSFSIREFIQERNPTSAMPVGSPSGGVLILFSIRGFIQGRIPTSVMNVGKPSVKAPI